MAAEKTNSLNPGDETPPETLGTGEDVCPECHGSGMDSRCFLRELRWHRKDRPRDWWRLTALRAAGDCRQEGAL